MILQKNNMTYSVNDFKFSTLVDLLRYRALHQPNKLAFTFLGDGETESSSLTYQELDQKARAIAAELQSLVAVGERALLLYPSGLEFIAAFFGCLYAGVVAVPAYPPRRNQKMSRLQAIAGDAQATVSLTTRELFTNIESRFAENPELARLCWVATDNIASEKAVAWQEPAVRSEMLGFLQYTSGSTGTPKGVMVSHGNLLHNSEYIKQAFELTPDSVSVSWLPSFHDMGLIDGIIQPIYTGFRGILMPPASFVQRPIRWLQAISRYRATHCGGPNFSYELCVSNITPEQRDTLDLSSWCSAYSGAEPIRKETLERFGASFKSCGFRASSFYPCYGMAETTLMISGGYVKDEPVYYTVEADGLEQNQVVKVSSDTQNVRHLVGCGHSRLDTKIVITNPELLTQCAPDQVGEIWVSGSSVTQGYWNQPELTKQIFRAQLQDTNSELFLRTGDLGFLQGDELFITGRLKDLIILRGRNHYPQDIELTVEQCHPALRPSCGAAFSVELNGTEKLVIVQEVERSYLRKLNANEVIETICRVVAQEHNVEVYAVLLLKTASIPKTSSGKIQRSACRAGFLTESLDIVADWNVNPEHRRQFQHLESEVESLLQQMKTDKQLGNFSGTDQSNVPAKSQQKSQSAEAITSWLISKIADQLQVFPQNIDIRQPLADYGLSSLSAVSISGKLQEWLGCQLSPTLLYNYPSIESLAQYLGGLETGVNRKAASQSPTTTDAIAIIGIGCRFPKAKDPQTFWQLLRDGIDAISEVPSRWDISTSSNQTPAHPDEMHIRWGGFLEQVDQFDPQFFGISPREAQLMDPQQRLLLEVSWEALENAGQTQQQLAGSQTGVFIGISNYDYSRLQFNDPIAATNAYSGTGNAFSIAANRLSYLLDLRGPSWAVDTACSSSLVAVHQACQSLRSGECHLALAGGVNLILTPELTITFSKSGMIAPDGRCKTFDTKADGYVRGEGSGVVVLKRIFDAQRDGDNILAVIRGSAVNSDGRSNGLTAPNGLSQQAVIRQALENAQVQPAQISYVETHGTGTSLGDPIELNSIKDVLMQGRALEQFCWIGSVKTNIGHLEAAAGIAGLIKVVLSLQHGEIPPHLHLEQLNPYISLEGTPLSIPTKHQQWFGEEPRLAGVSSFGFGGTNAHVILESVQAKASVENQLERPLHILTLSAKSEKSLREMAQKYVETLHLEASFADVCYTANTGRSHFEYRLAMVAESSSQLAEKLGVFITKTNAIGLLKGQVNSTNRPKIAWLFTGQGSQYIGMGRQLYEQAPTFRRTIDFCNDILRSDLKTPLLEVLYPTTNESLLLNQTAYTQPALFAIEYALAQLWQSWGIKPDAVMGHSVGEYVAATIAGVFTLEDALKLIFHRGRLMQELPNGGEMVAVMASLEKVNQLITPYTEKVAIAAVNGPQSVVISGQAEAIRTLSQSLESQGIKIKQLQVSHAFHSPLMEPMLADFEAIASEITYNQPTIPLISNVTGCTADDSITTASYWVNHVRQPVQFAQSMETLYQEGHEVFLEIGPKPILLTMGKRCLPSEVGVWLSSLRCGQEDWLRMLNSLGELYVEGIKIDWLGFDKDYARSRVILPTYPFQRQRYWIDQKKHQQAQPLPSENVLTKTINHIDKDTCEHLKQQKLIKEKDKFMFTKISGEASMRGEKILREIREIIAQELGFEQPSQVDIYKNLLEIGADSLTLMATVSKLEKNYGINITVRQFFEELTTVDGLAKYIDDNLSPEWGKEYTSEVQTPQPKQEEISFPQPAQSNIELNLAKAGIEGVPAASEGIMQQQLQVMFQVMSKQLEILQGQAYYTEQTSVSKNGKSSLINDANQILQKPNQKSDRQYNSPTVKHKQEFNKTSAKPSQGISTVDFGHPSPSNYLHTPVEIEQQLNLILPQLIQKADLDSYGEMPTELENLSVDYIIQAFKEMGWSYEIGESFSTESAVQSLGVVNSQQRLFKRSLQILAEVGILQSTKQQWKVLQTLEGANPEEKSQRLLSEYPNAQAELTLLHRCASQLSGVLQGTLEPLQLVFPQGDLTTATQLYQESPPARIINNLIQKAITIALEKLPPDRGVRFLEIGAGTGGTTSYILPHLNESQTEYFFTDIGAFFNARAKEKFRDYPYVRYQILDIEKNSKDQGFKPHHYDVIVAANVLHATTDLTQTLSHVLQLLAPGGMLVLWENTTPQRWLDLIFGLLGGWQKFNDLELRPDSPLLSKSKWEKLLRESGFAEVVTLPKDEEVPEALSREAVIIARADLTGLKQAQTAIMAGSKASLNKEQQSYLEEFIATYTRKTQKSQEMAQRYRPFLADKRATARWIRELKDMRYPIVGESANGSRIWDVDGNEYIDISLGFGVHLFGHNPQFITEAIQNWLKQGIQVGPQAKFAGEVAQLIHELTGMERVAFCNSGTEAMMSAVRLARLTTGRDKIVIFTGSYHGHFDGVLAVAPTNLNRKLKAAPVSLGVLQNMVDDVIVLDYGTKESLDIIKAHAHELAAVLVEPVQSRQLNLQPKEFLQELKQFTQQVGVALIFDEMVTGFRIHPGGAQAWFGIEADIVAYGKCVGGGIPIGIIAGKAVYMDGIDGGQWNYGDVSYPQKVQTFFGGTFNKNPLSIATAKAVLEYLKKEGSILQQNLNQHTSKLVKTLNTHFEQEHVPVQVVNFGSTFQFISSENVTYEFQPIELEILIHHLIQKGIYIWEGRVCFLSTVHTDEDIDYIISAVKQSISEMRQGGFFQKNNQQNYQTDVNKTERVRGVL